MNFSLKANFAGFDTSLYTQKGCKSSTCEGVAEFDNLTVRDVSPPSMIVLQSQ